MSLPEDLDRLLDLNDEEWDDFDCDWDHYYDQLDEDWDYNFDDEEGGLDD